MSELDSNKLRISLVTATYNIQETIEKTMRSIHDQDYPNLEHIVTDGGSTDKTLEIVRRFEDKLAHLSSETDDGLYHAINKGFSYATGDIFGWLNGDDMYFPWTLEYVNTIFRQFPEVDWIIGLHTFINAEGFLIQNQHSPSIYKSDWIRNGWFNERYLGFLQQESMFWRRSLWEQSGKSLNTKYKYSSDFELWTRFAEHATLVPVNIPLASFRTGSEEQLSTKNRATYNREVAEISKGRKKIPFVHRLLIRWGVFGRLLAHLTIWRKHPAVYYSVVKKAWVMENLFRCFANMLSYNILMILFRSKKVP